MSRHSPTKRLGPKGVARIVQDYKDGVSVKLLASRVGCSVDAVQHLLRMNTEFPMKRTAQ